MRKDGPHRTRRRVTGKTAMPTDAAHRNLVGRGFQKPCTGACLAAHSSQRLLWRICIAAPAQGDKTAMKVTSSGASEQYFPLAALPAMRERVGPRVAGNPDAASFAIALRMFAIVRARRPESQHGRRAQGFSRRSCGRMGINARLHPEDPVGNLLRLGFAQTCHDGKPGGHRHGGEKLAVPRCNAAKQ